MWEREEGELVRGYRAMPPPPHTQAYRSCYYCPAYTEVSYYTHVVQIVSKKKKQDGSSYLCMKKTTSTNSHIHTLTYHDLIP